MPPLLTSNRREALLMRIKANFADIQQKGGHTMRIEANFATFADIEQKQKVGYTRP